MTLHAVKRITGLRKHILVDAIAARPTNKAGRMVRLLASHDGLVQNGQVADLAYVAFGADGGSVGEEKKVGITL